MKKIYVASSWRNDRQQEVVQKLRDAKFAVYDYRNPAPNNRGFHWEEAGLNLTTEGKCEVGKLVDAHEHQVAKIGFAFDFGAMNRADACVLVLPCGRSAHLEAGWMIGQNKPTYVLMFDNELHEPELMYKMASKICTSIEEVIEELKRGDQLDSRRFCRCYLNANKPVIYINCPFHGLFQMAW